MNFRYRFTVSPAQMIADMQHFLTRRPDVEELLWAQSHGRLWIVLPHTVRVASMRFLKGYLEGESAHIDPELHQAFMLRRHFAQEDRFDLFDRRHVPHLQTPHYGLEVSVAKVHFMAWLATLRPSILLADTSDEIVPLKAKDVGGGGSEVDGCRCESARPLTHLDGRHLREGHELVGAPAKRRRVLGPAEALVSTKVGSHGQRAHAVQPTDGDQQPLWAPDMLVDVRHHTG